MNFREHQSTQISGFALVITLIMVVLAAIIVIALTISAASERTTSTSYHYRFQAELAVQNGFEAAKKALMASPTAAKSVVADDTFLVLRADGTQTNSSSGVHDAYYFLAKAEAGNANTVDLYPLFSGGTNYTRTINLAASPAVQAPTPPAKFTSNPAEQTFGTTTKQYPQLLSFQQTPYTQWQEVHDPNDPATAAPYTLPYQRYTFWVEDLAGYLDASQVGNCNGASTPCGSGKQQRSNGINPNEIALFTIFDQAQPNDSGSTLAKNLIDNRALLFTVPTLQQVAPPSGTDLTQPNLAVRLGVDTGGEQNLVPFGYGYPASVEGKPKTDLNSLVTAKNVSAVASAINTALPNFKTRAGGLPLTFDYAKNLAANIVDYADSNNAPTTDGSTYRGIGAFPFFMSAYDLNNWVSYSQKNGEYFANIEVTTYVQLWNPHNVTVTANAGDLIIHYDNVDSLNVNGNIVQYTAPPDYINGTSISILPNSYLVIVFPVKTYTFDWGPTPPASNANIPFPKDTTANTLRLTWKGKLADRTSQGLQRSSASVGMNYNGPPNNTITSRWEWRGNAAPPIYPTLGPTSGGTPGDPRISFYLGRTWTAANYEDNSAWGGRIELWKVAGPPQIQPSIWPDGGHDSTLGDNPTHSVKPDTSAAKVTANSDPKSPDRNMWVSRLSTKASLDTLTELGNVFDPGQWKYTIPSTNSSTSLPDIPTSATGDKTAGGGYSLCIGRPEFSKFDSNGQRAWQLLDVFGIGLRIGTTGMVNLNTASSEALRALAAGLILSRDLAVVPAGTLYPPKTGNTAREADLFAEAVINSRPLLSAGMLNAITNSNGPFFGNPNQWKNETVSSTSSAQPTEWNDSGREELFSRLLNLTTVRSRNFRVFVTGQALDKNGNVLSTVNKVFQVFLKPQPQRNANGSITSQQTEIRYEAFL